MAKHQTYDSRCYDLAEIFLADEALLNNEPHKAQLATAIQTAIEDEIHWMRHEQEVKAKAMDMIKVKPR